ncbi:MAG: ketoacyl-ACP synthase III [Bacteroidota bacterium]
MAFFSIPGIGITGISACVPHKICRNQDYSIIPEKERTEIIRVSGIKQKRHAGKSIAASDLCLSAAEALIAKLGWVKDEIDLLVFISQSPDYVLPATACVLQERLGLPKNCAAFDINMGCSAYVYGLSVVSGMLSWGGIRKALMLVGDVSTRGCSHRDKTTMTVFGDAGTATALEHDPCAPEMHFSLCTDGNKYRSIIIPEGGFRKPASSETFRYRKYGKGITRNRIQLALDGSPVFKFALTEVVPHIRQFMEQTGRDQKTIDYFVFHQANRIINEPVRKKLGLPAEKVPSSLSLFGNTGPASIPLTIVTELQKEIGIKPLSFLMSGFGAGFSWGSCIVEVRKPVCPVIIEYVTSADKTEKVKTG